ncbi:ommochrome-binding protein [Papilio machaon]|uniref:ommochrome-binding protein n=1 Tax=Papilio machaon TaxID=76193 RepID=UPI001E6632A2|nr:ommochrome-binding protein [Papilio machaon]
MYFFGAVSASMLFASLILSTISFATSAVGNRCKTCVKVNSACYNITHLFELQAPFRNTIVIHKMGILRSRNVLYFSFEPALEDLEYNKIGFVSLDNPEERGIISGNKILNFGTFDVDQNNEIIYLGGSDGIFVLETKENILAFFSSRGDSIQNLFYKGNVYFVINGQSKITRKKGDNFEAYLESERIKNFVITKNDVIVYLSILGLFATKRNETVLLSNNPFFRGLTIDLDDVVYTWWVDGIYKVNIAKNLLESNIHRVAYITTIGSMVFDNDNNILFTSDRGLYALTETNTTTIC